MSRPASTRAPSDALEARSHRLQLGIGLCGALLLLGAGLLLRPGSREVPAALAALPEAPRTPWPRYERTAWGSRWPDPDGDCRDLRAELLRQTSRTAVTWSEPAGCLVVAGQWTDPWTGTTYTQAGDLAVDHHVPLHLAHRSGGAAWSPGRKAAYYRNALAVPGALQVIARRTNAAKGNRGPETWQPPRRRSRCRYAQDWVAVKTAYGLSVTRAERAALADMLATC